MIIPFHDLKKSNDRFREAFENKLQSVLESGNTILGNEVACFERDFSSYCGTSHGIGTANGLDALVLIFKAYMELGLMQEGDEVIVPANTYIASILAISHAGLVPVPVEADIQTFNIDPASVEKAITFKTRAVMAVHLYGRLAPMSELSVLCKKHQLLLIEDAAQAHGAEMFLNGNLKKAGNLSDAAGFSFYPTKNLGALGDAGAVTTNNDRLARVIRKLRNYGSEKRYVCDSKGVNSRLDELQAAFLNVKLPFLDQDNENRRAVADRYLSEIKNPEIILPMAGGKDHVWHLFTVMCSRRDDLQSYLEANGIQTIVHYPVPPHRQQAYREWNVLSFEITEKIHREILSLPMGPLMTAPEVQKVIEVINHFR